MPTPAERKALLFFAVVLVLGASTRAYRVLHSRAPTDSKARSALEAQIKAADSARRSGLKKPKRERKQSEKEIEALRHVGPTLARRIIADRDSFGPFGSMEGLQRVKGIGPSMVEKLDSSVTFSLVPRPTNEVISRRSELPKARRKPHRRDMRP